MQSRMVGEAPASGPIVRSLDAYPGQSVAAAIVDTPQHPPEVYLLQAGAEPRRLTDSNPLLAERELARQEVVRYTARDGMELDMLVVHPFKSKRGGNPLVLVIHGGEDRLCPVSGACAFYEALGVEDKTLQVYEGLYHDLYNEPEHDLVLDDASAWLEARVSKDQL